MALRKINTATATVTATDSTVSYPSHRYPTRGKLGRHLSLPSLSPHPQVLRTEDKAKDRVLVSFKRRKDERYTFHLPQEIIFRILLLVPAQVLRKVVRYVCKQWFDIVSDPMFVRVHCQMSTSGFLIQNPKERSKIYYIQADTASLEVTKCEIPLHARIDGSFNGLVLLHDMTNPEIFHLVNPVVKKKFSLPPLTGLDDIFSKAGFGLDSSGLCKVVHASATAFSDQVQIKMRVFTVGIDTSWRFIDLQGISLDTKEKYALKCSPRFIAGFIYWYNMPYYKGVALDVDTETIYQFSFPVDLTRRDATSIRFLSTETCLGLVRTNRDIWRFWKLTDLKTSEWTEVAGINIRPVLSRVDKMFYPREMFSVWPVMVINGDFWFYRCVDNKEYAVVRYNLVSDNFSFFPMTRVYSDTPIYPHVHTLVSPKNCKPGIVCSWKDDYNKY